MFKCSLVLVALLQQILSYHHGFQAYRQRPSVDLPQNDNRFLNFDNFDINIRSGRQLSPGFEWDSPSDNFNQDNNFNNGRRFNSGSWDSQQEDPDDSFIFEDDFDNRNNVARTTQRPRITNWSRRRTTQRTPTSTVAIPGMGTPRTPCEDRCLSTPEYNPVCGDDDMTYFSRHRLNCAQRCGKRVKLKHVGACSLIPPRG